MSAVSASRLCAAPPPPSEEEAAAAFAGSETPGVPVSSSAAARPKTAARFKPVILFNGNPSYDHLNPRRGFPPQFHDTRMGKACISSIFQNPQKSGRFSHKPALRGKFDDAGKWTIYISPYLL